MISTRYFHGAAPESTSLSPSPILASGAEKAGAEVVSS